MGTREFKPWGRGGGGFDPTNLLQVTDPKIHVSTAIWDTWLGKILVPFCFKTNHSLHAVFFSQYTTVKPKSIVP